MTSGGIRSVVRDAVGTSPLGVGGAIFFWFAAFLHRIRIAAAGLRFVRKVVANRGKGVC